MVSAAIGYTGSTEWDTSKPAGTPPKLLDVGTLRDRGWEPTISLRDGIGDTVSWCRSKHAALRV